MNRSLYPFPDATTKFGRRVVIHFSDASTRDEREQAWKEYRGGSGMAEIGLAANVLEKSGYDWQTATSPEDVVALAEAIRDLAAQPLVVERQLPLSWLVDNSGAPLGATSLSAIAQAIEYAELVDEDWRTLVQSTTAIKVILEKLPRLQALVARDDAVIAAEQWQAEHPRPAPAPIKAPTVVAQPTAPSNATSEPRLHGKARKEQRRREAEVRKANAQPPKPGEVFRRHGVLEVICTGSRCQRFFPLEEARVAKSIKSVQHALHVRRFSEITEGNLPNVCLCPDCADRILKSGHQSLAEAIVARDEAIIAAEQWQAEHPRPAPAKKPHPRHTGSAYTV